MRKSHKRKPREFYVAITNYGTPFEGALDVNWKSNGKKWFQNTQPDAHIILVREVKRKGSK